MCKVENKTVHLLGNESTHLTMYILFKFFTQGMYLPQCEFSGQKEGRKEGEEEGDSDNIFRILLADQKKKIEVGNLMGKTKCRGRER